ncbi:hypothetical protein LTR16_012823, partial [Cryomyces antarcticus]
MRRPPSLPLPRSSVTEKPSRRTSLLPESPTLARRSARLRRRSRRKARLLARRTTAERSQRGRKPRQTS